MRLPITRLLAYLVVGIAVTVALTWGYTQVILPASTSTNPKVTWTTDPLTISFAATDGSGSATDTFSCSGNAGPISLRTISNSPTNIALTTNPAGFGNCGTSLLQVTITAACLVPADQCRGNYSGLVQVRQPTNYRNLPANLQISIVAG